MSQPDLVIFDCDGVLVDSEIIAARVEASVLGEAGYVIEPEEYAERFAGLTFREAVMRIEKESQIPFQAKILEENERRLDAKLRTDARGVEGVREAVAAVTARRCVCSNSKPHRLDFMLANAGLSSFFEGHIYSARTLPQGSKPKPAPDVFLYALDQEKARAEATFVIEDSVHGVHGAVAAGLRVIGFTGASHSWPGHADALTDAGAETVIRRWSELKPTLQALSEWSEARA